MAHLVPDAERRCCLEVEMPHVPLDFFERSLAVPDGWCDTPVAYLLLSEPCRSDVERSRCLGWPTIERAGGHLDLVTVPGELARSIIDLAERLAVSGKVPGLGEVTASGFKRR